MLAILLALQAISAGAAEAPQVISVEPADATVLDFADDTSFRNDVLKAGELKRQGQMLKAFRTLYDQIGVAVGDEEKLINKLDRSSCSEGLNQQCVLAVGTVSVPEQPAPAHVQDFVNLYIQSGHFDDVDVADARPILFTWERVGPEAAGLIDAWRQEAAKGTPFFCGKSTCLQLFGVSTDESGSGREPPSYAVLPLTDGTDALPSLAVCKVERFGAAMGPPNKCIAVLAQSGGATYAISIGASGLKSRGSRNPPRPVEARGPGEPPPILRVGVSGVPRDWLAKSVEQALVRPTLELSAVAIDAYTVQASTGFRNSPVLAPLREWGSFELWLEPAKIGWLIHLDSDLRVTRQNNSADLRHSTLDEDAQYQKRIRQAIRGWLLSACARLPRHCDLSR